MAEITRLEYFAGLAMQGMITLMRGSGTTDAHLSTRAFEVAQAMDAVAAKHNPDDQASAMAAEAGKALVAELQAGE